MAKLNGWFFHTYDKIYIFLYLSQVDWDTGSGGTAELRFAIINKLFVWTVVRFLCISCITHRNQNGGE